MVKLFVKIYQCFISFIFGIILKAVWSPKDSIVMAYTIFLQRLRYKLIKSRSKKLGIGHFFPRSFRYVSSLKGPRYDFRWKFYF